MTRRRYIQDRQTLELIEADAYVQPDAPRVYVHGDYDTYLSPVTGKPVSGRVQRREDMKRAGCVDYEPSLKRIQEKRLAESRPFADVGIDGPPAQYVRQAPSVLRAKR